MATPRVIYEAKPGSPLEVDRERYARLARRDGGPHARGAVRRCPRRIGPRVAGARGPDLPHRRRRGAAGRRSQRVEPGQSARALLGLAHAPAPPGAPDDVRPALVVPALSPADADDHRPTPSSTGATRTAAAATICSARAATPTCTSSSTARSSTSAATAISCARCAPFHLTELDVHDVLNVFQVTGLTPEGRYFVKPSPARTRRLHRVLRGDRRALRDLGVPARRSLGAGVGARRRRSARHVPAARRRDLAAGRGAPRRVGAAGSRRTTRGGHGLLSKGT